MNITFRNTAGPSKHQAVAVRNGADMSTFYSCSFEGYQDTLYTHSLRQFYRECDIYGTVDFIFGNAAVVLQNCNMYPRLPMSGQFNAITAQGRTDPNQNTGISIQNATIKAAQDLAPVVEYDNTGPGSNTANRVNWPGYHVIDATDAANFTVSNFLVGNDWVPQTSVPYQTSL
ncbi:putative pectinesterase/pectinesterase inhibitor 7 [Glycine soja]|uniref:Pectinesterase n=1 Tax=Glycine soja TaxID=3848 RepID=A0A445FJK9_GLYSO|nr:putative pectinesterase/pectinesterase inhibitor 7 [Glycine soja]